MLEQHLRTPDASDVELVRSPDLPGGEPPPTRAALWWIVAAVLTVATPWALYRMTRRRAARPPPRRTDSHNAASDRRSGTTPIASTFLRLDQTDPLVRNLVKQISSHPSVAAWLSVRQADSQLRRGRRERRRGTYPGGSPAGAAAGGGLQGERPRRTDRHRPPRLRALRRVRRGGRVHRSGRGRAAVRHTQAAPRGSAPRPRLEHVARPHARTGDRGAPQDAGGGRSDRRSTGGGDGLRVYRSRSRGADAAKTALHRGANVQKIRRPLRSIALALGLPMNGYRGSGK